MLRVLFVLGVVGGTSPQCGVPSLLLQEAIRKAIDRTLPTGRVTVEMEQEAQARFLTELEALTVKNDHAGCEQQLNREHNSAVKAMREGLFLERIRAAEGYEAEKIVRDAVEGITGPEKSRAIIDAFLEFKKEYSKKHKIAFVGSKILDDDLKELERRTVGFPESFLERLRQKFRSMEKTFETRVKSAKDLTAVLEYNQKEIDNICASVEEFKDLFDCAEIAEKALHTYNARKKPWQELIARRDIMKKALDDSDVVILSRDRRNRMYALRKGLKQEMRDMNIDSGIEVGLVNYSSRDGKEDLEHVMFNLGDKIVKEIEARESADELDVLAHNIKVGLFPRLCADLKHEWGTDEGCTKYLDEYFDSKLKPSFDKQRNSFPERSKSHS
jgi:hypothetical protein